MLARLPPDLRVIADAAYDSAELRRWLADRGSRVIIPNRKNRKQPYPFDAITYRRRNIVERTFCRLKDFRRLATRYDRLDETFVSTLCIAAALAYFLKSSDEFRPSKRVCPSPCFRPPLSSAQKSEMHGRARGRFAPIAILAIAAVFPLLPKVCWNVFACRALHISANPPRWSGGIPWKTRSENCSEKS